MGLKTLGIYLSTTVFAIVIGLVVVNLIRPGEVFPREKAAEFRSRYEQSVSEKAIAAESMRGDSPLQFFVDMVPENVVRSAGDNSAMLQIVLLSIAFGIATVAVGKERAAPVKKLVESLNEIILKIIGYVMKLAPLGVMALMADLIVGFAGDSDLLLALGYYALTVVIGLCVILLICYPLIVRLFTDIRLPDYARAVLPVQMLAFTSCSSAACLPVNIEQMRRLGLPHNVISFVLPTGVTVNMNGTSCYHAIATVFVAQVMGIELSLAQMLSIVVLTTVSSIGTPGIPSGGMAVLTLVLVSVGIPAEGIAMIIAMDRPLDMLITAVNVSGDAMAACVVSRGERSESAETVTPTHTNTEQS
ncbi:MAG: dicarboxylate/amino acid:cation symporter [Alistipes sp.]